MDTQILEDIGLTTAEIKVYLSLLELGTSTAGPIIEKSGLQSSVVFITLNKLVEKGFISFIKEGQRKHYQASNPQNILVFIEEKKQKFEKILPELQSKVAKSKEKPEATLFRGKRGIKQLLLDFLETEKTGYYVMGSPKNSLMLGEAWWVDFHKKRGFKKIKAKIIFNESLKSWSPGKKYPLSELRYTRTGFEPLTETIISDNKIGIIIWTDKPTGILISNKDAYESYLKFFDIAWKVAKK